MENNTPTNNFDFDINIIANFFKNLDRQGPGADSQTLLALSLIKDLLPQGKNLQIADLGCGTGKQTAVLAQALDAHITAVDLLPQMIQGLKERIANKEYRDKITPLLGTMESLPFPDESLDIIWAEGSIYHMGFEKGLSQWRKHLHKGGFVAVTECCWLSDQRPDDTKWFTDNFTEIDTIYNKCHILQNCGYSPIAQFILPSECWVENYYKPMSKHIEEYALLHKNNPTADMFLSALRTEIEQYRRYSQYYGYVFFITKKV